jgi:2-dehydro-3-deoxyphosphogluconate aldolase/(4S)-4-hydroxy-2-oxoglutarate aldolase
VSIDLVAALRRHRLLAIVRGSDRAATVRAALTLAESGVRLLEISLSGSDARAALAQVCAQVDADTLVGAGTVITADDTAVARDAGARFVVTPGNGPSVANAAQLGLPALVGAFTPTEVIAALPVAAAVKVFPASLGGAEYLRALRAPFPDAPFVPVGGVDAEATAAYLAAGAIAVGVGSPLLGDAADAGGDLDALRQRIVQYRAATQ